MSDKYKNKVVIKKKPLTEIFITFFYVQKLGETSCAALQKQFLANALLDWAVLEDAGIL